MKTNIMTKLILGLAIAYPSLCHAQSSKLSGELDINREVALAGTSPTLTWNITYPAASVTDVVNIGGDDEVTATKELDVEVSVLGGASQFRADRRGRRAWKNSQLDIRVGGLAYQNIFTGQQPDIKPNSSVFTYTLKPNDSINLRSRNNNTTTTNWNPWRDTGPGAANPENVVVLANGDTPPSNVPAQDQSSIKDFLRPYLKGGKVSIGPRDLIYLFELGHNLPNSYGGGDMQDMVVLITFKDPKNNNGHGNNADGVDSSNPGNSNKTDSDPTVDDEIR